MAPVSRVSTSVTEVKLVISASSPVLNLIEFPTSPAANSPVPVDRVTVVPVLANVPSGAVEFAVASDPARQAFRFSLNDVPFADDGACVIQTTIPP